MEVLNVLKEKGIIDDATIASIQEEIDRGGKTVEAALLERGVSSGDLLEAQGDYYQVPTRRLGPNETVPFEVLNHVPEESAKHYHFVPLGVVDGVLEVGTTDPDNLEAIEALNFITGRTNIPYKLFLISEEDFARVIEMYKGLTGEVGQALTELQTTISLDDQETGAAETNIKEKSNSTEPGLIKEDAPVTKIVATVLRYAVDGKASDIHIEPTQDGLQVRFRVDGVMHTSLKLPKKVERAVVARIKVLATLKLDERRKPQDGRFSATVDERVIDFRVSTFPTYHGEKVVMRILDRSQENLTLEALGLSPQNINTLRQALRRPYGIIIISGPTGSGKSTTLYGMLQEIDREKKNVVSLEDPVEYDVQGVAQSQVRPEIGYTFANGLRSILRQDPDIIMVGEIRDRETAQLAIQAALTGHLVFTTLHTNNAIGVVPRLVDMGIDPYLIAPTLALSVAQRLVRKRCDGAGKKMPYEGAIEQMIKKEFEGVPESIMKQVPRPDSVYGIESTPDCPNGTRGRVAVFEMLPTSTELEKVILENPTEDAIFNVARTQGMLTMKEDAIIKMLEGTVPFEEVNTLGTDIIVE
ncbi:MAG: GspE/PulE family protein [Patescibacteria group bacterium UBA2163]